MQLGLHSAAKSTKTERRDFFWKNNRISGSHKKTRLYNVTMLAHEHIAKKLGTVNTQTGLDNIQEVVLPSTCGATWHLGFNHIRCREGIWLHLKQLLDLAHVGIRGHDKGESIGEGEELGGFIQPLLLWNSLRWRHRRSGELGQIHSKLQERPWKSVTSWPGNELIGTVLGINWQSCATFQILSFQILFELKRNSQ